MFTKSVKYYEIAYKTSITLFMFYFETIICNGFILLIKKNVLTPGFVFDLKIISRNWEASRLHNLTMPFYFHRFC